MTIGDNYNDMEMISRRRRWGRRRECAGTDPRACYVPYLRCPADRGSSRLCARWRVR